MGNCQAAEAATVLIQHPGGKVQRMYWAVAASEVMSANPGHYVAVMLTAPPPAAAAGNGPSTTVRHLKLLRPDDTLRVGHVLKELASKNHAKLSKLRLAQQQGQEKKEKDMEKTTGRGRGRRRVPFSSERGERSWRSPQSDGIPAEQQPRRQQPEEDDAHADTMAGGSITAGYGSSRFGGAPTRHGHWRPSLQSIAEVGGM
ncbi:unnamed protein product [Spirodela intermedia]|uniref:Uncharacterized protein n=1 Tax=Spirodela intermedia TaxID=51605 RepID=A0A7I8II65_SPIIN|nr:unnamed protein product [Spirodela intermedia]CAA6657542.1 unnamed protein product [Spirodela intermedia]